MEPQRNLAVEHAGTFGLPEPAINETGAQYRERIARELAAMGKPVYAQEALWNQRMSGDLFAHGSLDRGYGDDFVTQVAEGAEAVYEASQREGCMRGLLRRAFRL